MPVSRFEDFVIVGQPCELKLTDGEDTLHAKGKIHYLFPNRMDCVVEVEEVLQQKGTLPTYLLNRNLYFVPCEEVRL